MQWALLLVFLALPVVPSRASCQDPAVYFVCPNTSEACSPGWTCITANEIEFSSNSVFKFYPGQHVISELKHMDNVSCVKIMKAEPETSIGYGDLNPRVEIMYTGSSPSAALWCTNVTHVYVSDIDAINFGITVKEGLNVTLSNLVIDGPMFGLNITNTVDVNISHCLVKNIRKNGIILRNTRHAIILNTIVNNTNWIGIT